MEPSTAPGPTNPNSQSTVSLCKFNLRLDAGKIEKSSFEFDRRLYAYSYTSPQLIREGQLRAACIASTNPSSLSGIGRDGDDAATSQTNPLTAK